MNAPASHEVYEFGPFRFETQHLYLFRSDQPVAIAAKALSVLAFLIRHRDRVVSKADIVAEVWAGISVQDNDLSVQMTALRKALSGAESHVYIETVPRRGYQFVGDVRVARPVDQA